MNVPKRSALSHAFQPDMLKLTLEKKNNKERIGNCCVYPFVGQLDTLVEKGDDKALMKQYNLFMQEKNGAETRKKRAGQSVPHLKKPAVNIDEIRANLQKESTMLDTAMNFKINSSLPMPSYLSNHLSPVQSCC